MSETTAEESKLPGEESQENNSNSETENASVNHNHSIRSDIAEPASLVSTNSSPAHLPDKQASATVTVILKPTGDVPILKNTTYKVEPTRTIGSITEFIRGKLRFQKSDSLFLFVSQCFAPAPDQVVKNILDCFGVDGKIVLHYSRVQAWG